MNVLKTFLLQAGFSEKLCATMVHFTQYFAFMLFAAQAISRLAQRTLPRTHYGR